MIEKRTDPKPPDTYQAITDLLAEGYYRSGARISAITLARRLGVSTTPVREALARLAGRDLIEERHGEGYYAPFLGSRAIADLYTSHGRTIDLALEQRGADKIIRSGRDIWMTFERITILTGDIALVGVQRYLSDRLRPLRRVERQIVEDLPDLSRAFASAIKKNPAEARETSRLFHHQCAQAAGVLSDALNRAV